MPTSATLPHARHYIDGQWQDSVSCGESRNPATNGLLGTFADGGAQEARSAVAAARRAFHSTAWSRDRHRRAAALHELADRLEHRKEELITLLARENGKVLAEAALEVEGTIRSRGTLIVFR
ncbi:aldehyde dehydrogenase family protein [Streptomyces niveus]|uniref:aldehyde dehydrogenase family protein n=1 Tax=Streptomyces niveus TaxID=193462 RepID=UPI0034446E79